MALAGCASLFTTFFFLLFFYIIIVASIIIGVFGLLESIITDAEGTAVLVLARS